ncbi:hypothetical protein SAMN04488028_10636 [Reichenbachiella agariperforans]|uniref:DUF5018 domain-containing protein n=1 Tax=Reichenbachiella agariperforans TaxID=156994 RepID=A0A1M6TGP9_REIAG|nr:hypothetical protein [Reichenbachiella agariperforans]SHK56157.1 hypothetical protein SAMN04488028_10636 [Reichenbachiella agariperforans]
MKKLVPYLLLFTVIACQEEELNQEELNPDNQIVSLRINTFEISIDHASHEIVVIADYGEDLTDVLATIKLPAGASCDPDLSAPLDLSEDVKLEVTAENGDKVTYSVKVKKRPGISSFKVYGREALINNNMITFDIYQSSDLTSIQPVVALGEGLTISPSIDQPIDFTKPVTFTVETEEGLSTSYQTQVNYINGVESVEFYIGNHSSTGYVNSGNIISIDVSYTKVEKYLEDYLINIQPRLLNGFSKTDNIVMDHFLTDLTFAVTDPLGNEEKYTISFKNTENEILSFQNPEVFQSYPSDWGRRNYTGVVGDDFRGMPDTHCYLIYVWSYVDLSRFSLIATVSEGASIQEGNNTPLDFTNDRYITVISESGHSQKYLIRIKPYTVQFTDYHGYIRNCDSQKSTTPQSFTIKYRSYDKLETVSLVDQSDANHIIDLTINSNYYTSPGKFANISLGYPEAIPEGDYYLTGTLENGDSFSLTQGLCFYE